MKIKNTIGYLLVVVSLYSQQAKCEVDPTLKQVTDKLNAAGIYPNEEALNREFEYGNEQLSFEERAQREAKLLSDQVTKTTLNAFEKSFNELNDIEAAKKEVLEYMEEELSLVSDEFKPLLKLQVNKALEFSNSSAGIENSEKLLAIMKKTSQERTAIIEMALTTGANNMAKSGGHGESDDDAASNIEVDNRGPLSPRNFNSKNDVALELVKDKRNERWVNTTNSTVRVGEMTSSKAKFALNVNIEFMGAKAEFGPTIAFWKEYTTSVTLLTEGLTPMFNQNGVFDYYVRDNQGRAIRENGDYVRRLIIFTCNAEEEFGTEYGGEGEFKIPIIGGDIGPVAVGLEVQANLVKAKEFSNFVSL